MEPKPLEHFDNKSKEPVTEGSRPEILDTYTPHLRDSANNLERMGGNPAIFREELERAEQEVTRARQIFARHGIDVRSAWNQPSREEAPHSYTLQGMIDRENSEWELLKRSFPEIMLPQRQSLKEYLASNPNLPFVAKNIEDHKGMNKFLVEVPWQLERLKNWISSQRDYALRDWVAEEYIEGPSKPASTYRIVMGATGLPIAASLIYADQPSRRDGLIVDRTREGWEKDLVDPHSPNFLDSSEFRSNVAVNGHIVPLSINGELHATQELSEGDKQILEQHGIQDRTLPPALLEQASKIAKLIGPGKALILGIDYLQSKDGKWYFLEANPVPAVETVRIWWDLSPSLSDEDVYDKLYDVVGRDLNRIYGPPIDSTPA